MRVRSAVVCLLFLFAFSGSAVARDWFVRAGSNGDGSLAKPFGDPWQALAKCTAGDAIHVTEGEYYGRMGGACWEIPFANVKLFGGYSKDFSKRNPWKYLSHLAWKAGSKNMCKDGRVHGGRDHSGAVLDGFVIDMQDENEYIQGSLNVKMHPNSPVILNQPGVVIRNNVIANSGSEGLRVRAGATVENNVIVNSVFRGIQVSKGSPTGRDSNKPVVVRHNTVLFTWDEKSPAKGGSRGIDIETDAETVIDANIIAHADNHGVVSYRGATPKITLTNNVFHMNLYSNFKLQYEGQDVGIDDEQMDMIEEVGLKDAAGNEVADPKLAYNPKWLDLFSRREAAALGKVTMDDWNKARRVLGLPVVGKGGKAAKNLAPPWRWQDAVAMTAPGNRSIKAGARAKDLPVAFSGTGAVAAAAPQRDYQKSHVAAWSRNAQAVDRKPVEVKVAVGGPTQPRGLAGEIDNKTHKARFLFDADKPSERIYGYYAKGSQVERVIDSASNYYGGPVTRPYIVRGVARVVKNIPKAGIVIDSIEPYSPDLSAAPKKARPAGRDWFVRAGAKRGDGSKAKPFGNLYKALKKVNKGDRIHVTEGEYHGFLNTATWKIDKPYLALYGGYDARFAERDPWKHPTLLVWKKGKTKPKGYTIEGAGNHEGLIIDGFVFDRKSMNRYKANGDLEFAMSPSAEHIWVNAKDVTIRNCVFVNGARGALRLTGEQVVENNIFVNHIFSVVDIIATNDGGGYSVFRNNTVLFSWNRNERAGLDGQASGYGLMTRIAKARIENNIFAFMDNNGVKLESAGRDIELVGNVFSHNLFSNVVYKSKDVVDDKTMGMIGQLGLKKASGNQVRNPDFPIDAKWFEVYTSRSAGVPGKVTMDDWNQMRQILGQPLIAKGGKPGHGFAPAYDWHQALKLFPRKNGIQAGAKRGGTKIEYTNSH